MLEEDPVTSLTIREALFAHRSAITPGLWDIARDSRRPARDRLRSALALCLYDPPLLSNARHGPPAWDEIAGPVAEELVTMLDANPTAYATVLGAVRPIQGLLSGKLKEHFVRRGDRRLQTATNLLIDLVRDDPHAVCELRSRPTTISSSRSIHCSRGTGRVSCPSCGPRPLPSAAGRTAGDEEAMRPPRSGSDLLAEARRGSGAWEIFRNEPDPRARTFVIYDSARYGLPLATLISRLKVDDDPSRIRGLLFAIGQHGALEASAAESRLVESLIRERFLGHDDAGVHGAAEWLLGKLGDSGNASDLNPAAASTRTAAPRRWFLTSEGHTMVIIDARHDPRIKRVFAIAARETTIEQMLRFDPAHWHNKEKSVGPTCPMGVVNWPRAIDYCEWLNGRERLAESQSCYTRGNERLAYSMVRPDLTRTGYRLPTLDEWQFACRAGTTTRRYYGDDNNDELLHHYVWVTQKGAQPHLQPVGRLMPNDFGLFDMYGNVSEWNADGPDQNNHVFTSGGGFRSLPQEFSSHYYTTTTPDLLYNQFGFRIARTIELNEKGAPE